MFFVYRFLDSNESVIYIGKSKQSLEYRFRGHQHLPKECYDLVKQIEYISCSTEADMSIKEIYYINKYQQNPIFYNVQDVTQLPTSIIFEDHWEMYKGPLPSTFRHSINFTQGFISEPKVSYTKNGEILKVVCNKQTGISSTVHALNAKEVNEIASYLIDEIRFAANQNQEQIRFRNLVMFVLGTNLPLKINDLLKLKYCDLFNENDQPKSYTLNLGRLYKDEIVSIPLRKNVKAVLQSYCAKYNWTYAQNSNDFFFVSRKHQVMTVQSCWRILSDVANAVGIKKNIGSESLRKTYGLTIYQRSKNKLDALVFLEKLWGQNLYGNIIGYLGLHDEKVNLDNYFGEKFALCDIDLSDLDI